MNMPICMFAMYIKLEHVDMQLTCNANVDSNAVFIREILTYK